MNGGPGFRVHTFGGPRPRARPRNPGQQEPENTFYDMFVQLLPIIILFILPVITNLFGTILGGDSVGGATGPKQPPMVFEEADPVQGFTEQRTMADLGIDYFVREKDIEKHSEKDLFNLDRRAGMIYQNALRSQCSEEMKEKNRLAGLARGWFVDDPEKMEVALRYEMPSCERYERLQGIAGEAQGDALR